MDEPTAKTCKNCEQRKPIGDYYVRRGKPQARCKACVIAQNKAYGDSHPEVRRGISRRWREKNPEAVRARNVAYYQEHRESNNERVNRWRVENREAWLQLQAKWRDDDERRKDARTRTARWRDENPDRVAEWVAANHDRLLEHSSRRRARQRATQVGRIDLEALWVASAGACGLCGEDVDRSLKYPDPLSRSLDHVIPLARGGAHSQDNLQWTHLVCNVRKGAKILPT